MARKLPPRAGAGEEAGAGAALDDSPGRSGRPRGLGEAAEAVGLDERVQRPTLPTRGPRRRAVLPGLWSGRPGALRRPGCEGVGRASAETFAPLQTRPSWRKKARLAPKASESVAVGLRCPSGCVRPRHSHPPRRGGFTLTHTLPQDARGWGGAATEPRSPHAGSARRGGTAFLAPSRGPPARRHTSARSRAPPAGPLGAPRSSGQLPGVSGDGEESHKAKEAAKRRRRRSRGQGPVDSPGVGRGNTEGAAKAPGGRAWPSGSAPTRGSPSLPFPGSWLPLRAVSSSSPRALSAPARDSVLGIKRKEGGEKGGEGKGRRRKEDDPSKGGC